MSKRILPPDPPERPPEGVNVTRRGEVYQTLYKPGGGLTSLMPPSRALPEGDWSWAGSWYVVTTHCVEGEVEQTEWRRYLEVAKR